MTRLQGWAACLVLAVALAGCGGEDGNGDAPSGGPVGVDQSTPEALAESIFRAAASGDFEGLAAIAAPGADGDSKNVAGVGAASADKQADFRKWFQKGKVAAKPRVTGDRAEVDILFGPDGTKKETFKMVKVGGVWLLESF